MTQVQRLITECVESAISDFNQNEQYLISRDLSERCICAKFASYLERSLERSIFHEYVVDVEYNRGNRGNEYAAKRLNGHNIVVDLIAHKRGYDNDRGFDNLFCIEMKKGYKPHGITSDKERLYIMTDSKYGFGYKAGFMILAISNRRTHEHKLIIESKYYRADHSLLTIPGQVEIDPND